MMSDIERLLDRRNDATAVTIGPAVVTSPDATVGKKRVLTGIRPTGPLHIGHYAGALENWVKLQEQYECYFLIADYQVADHADNLPFVRNAVWAVALDWLAVGLDPERGSFVVESLVPEHAELTTWLAGSCPSGCWNATRRSRPRWTRSRIPTMR
jgi:tryptophanyl-tRNA synthetase